MKCVKGYEVTALRSDSGWYMGAESEDGTPLCRITSGYATKMDGTQYLPLDRQDAMENIYCNKCGKCFNTTEKKKNHRSVLTGLIKR
jgi:hypothetical protein